MFNDVEKDTFGFVPDEEENNFNYNHISGLGESDYENEDLFNVEVESNNTVEPSNFEPSNNDDSLYKNVEIPLEYESSSMFQYNNPLNMEPQNEDSKEDSSDEDGGTDAVVGNDVLDSNETEEIPEAEEISKNAHSNSSVDNEFLDSESAFVGNSIENKYELPVAEPVASEPVIEETTVVEESVEQPKAESAMFNDTSIEELNKLTEFKEEKVQTTDIKSLFDRVGVNVKEASDIFKKNTEMKEKIDSRFEELKKLQAEVEKSKKSQYDEINAYKEEVLGKLTEKKEEIEKRLNKLREFQTNLEKEKEEFEKFRKAQKEEIERVQKEIQEAYDSRREELNHIEDVLRRQKDSLDEERNQLSLDKIQYESDKNELANNLLKFNEIVDSFTSGMDKINKE